MKIKIRQIENKIFGEIRKVISRTDSKYDQKRVMKSASSAALMSKTSEDKEKTLCLQKSHLRLCPVDGLSKQIGRAHV